MGVPKETTIPDPRGTDRERASFLELLWDDAIERQVQQRARDEVERMRTKLLAEIDDEKARAVKFAIAYVEGRKRDFESEGRFQGIAYGVFGTLLFVFLVVIASHHR